MAKLLSGTRVYGNATVDTFVTVGTNVSAANVVITNASRLGTVTSGTWNGSSISTTYTEAKVISVNGSTGAVSGLATTANLDLKANVVDLTTANVTEQTNLYFTNARARASISVTGSATYDSNTGVIAVAVSSFPTGDYGDLTQVVDAFGISTASTFDCNQAGSITSTDFGSV